MSIYYKYPRTYHCYWSHGLQNDDRKQEDYTVLKQSEIVVSLKLDGENTNMYPDKIHARSIDSGDHLSRHYVKGLWGQIKHLIPNGWRICGENVYAKHSIFYDDLEAYFYVFSIWDENNVCFSYRDTLDICKEFGLKHIPVIYIGQYDESKLKEIAETLDKEKNEGYVVRTSGSFSFSDFNKNVMKYVREKHVQTSNHWLNEVMIQNKLK